MRRIFCYLGCIGFVWLEAQNPYFQNIQPIFKEILSQHLEYNTFSPSLLQRATLLYIDRFDNEQAYFLEGEIRPFLFRSAEAWEASFRWIMQDQFSDFIVLQEKMNEVILRARGMRQDMKNDVIQCSLQEMRNQLAKKISFRQEFSKTEQELYLKQRLKALRWCVHYLENVVQPTFEDREKAWALFNKIQEQKEEKFLLPSEDRRCAENILKSLASSLDAHTAYFNQQEVYEIRARLNKQFYGTGILVGETDAGFVITAILPESPAQQTGLLQAQDQILSIDEFPTEGMTLSQVVELMQGEKGIPISLRIKTRMGKIYSVHLMREKIVMDEDRLQVEAIPHRDGYIGYIELTSFYDNREGMTAEGDLRVAITQLRKQGPLYGLVLDLRKNLGGFVDQAIRVAGMFIDKGVIVLAKYADKEVRYSQEYDPRVTYRGPLVILTSKMSASAAEIVAQSLQDYGAAIVVGDRRTYGKGSMQMQTVTDVNAPYHYAVTVGRYYTISGRSTQIEGVKPQIYVPTEFANAAIGERFLRFPLCADRLCFSSSVQITDNKEVNSNLDVLFSFYHKYRYQRSFWSKSLPILLKNNELRVSKLGGYSTLLARSQEDLMAFAQSEAIHIVMDMDFFQRSIASSNLIEK